MTVSPSRAAAFNILLRVERERAYAAELLHSEACSTLSNQDHGLATELVMGVLRWRSVLDSEIASQSSQPLQKLDREVITALRMACYQLRFLERVPARAAVNESVELIKNARKRSAVPFVNAVLRKLANAPSHALDSPTTEELSDTQQISSAYSHPLWIVERWSASYGLTTASNICNYDQKVPESCVRITTAEIEAELEREGFELAAGKLLSAARYVKSGNVTTTHAYREGRLTIQDEASQLVALLVGKGSRILDCCAAPGGKTRVLAENNPTSTVTAVELHPHRARLLRKLVPNSNVEILNEDIAHLSPEKMFDRVLADVPCSGTGTLARNPEIKWSLTPEDLTDLQSRQLTILQAAMNHLATGGRLVYSTCSLEPEENEQVVENALSSNPQFQLLDCRIALEELRARGELAVNDLDSITAGPFLRTIPGLQECDGFFAAVISR